jgi:hypothetical protein
MLDHGFSDVTGLMVYTTLNEEQDAGSNSGIKNRKNKDGGITLGNLRTACL